MPQVELRSYRFDRPAHWAICGRDGFVTDGDGLLVAGGERWQAIAHGTADRDPIAATVAPDGATYWVRRTGELVRHADGSAATLGRLGDFGAASSIASFLAVGSDRVWLLHDESLSIYGLPDLRPLGTQPVGPARAMGLGTDGAWCLIAPDSGGWRWRQVDAAGGSRRPDVACPAGPAPSGGALDLSGRRLMVLTPDAVWRREPTEADWRLELDLGPYRCEFEPDAIAADCHGTLFLLDRKRAAVWSFSEGARAVRWRLDAAIGTGASIAAGTGAVIAAQGGLYRLAAPDAAEPETAEGEPREGVLLTPLLVSPRDPGGGWHRARVVADLPPGTEARIRLAASDDDAVRDRISAIAARPGQTATERLRSVYGLLPWDDRLETVLAAADDPLGTGAFEVSLDGVDTPYVALALHFHVPPSSRPARLRRLEVRYPSRSWITDLPAVYASDPPRASELRRFLAVLETIFDGLEERIDGLTERIAPSGPDEQFLPFLLRWLGLPLAADLSSARMRAFLRAAPELLRRRGTPWAIERALAIVTGAPVRVTDLGDGPLPLVLAAEGTKLGHDTVLIRRPQHGFALGTVARLGRHGLGRKPTTDADAVAARTLSIRIALAAEPKGAERAAAEAVIDFFLPAACRCEMAVLPPGAGAGERRLDSSARLARTWSGGSGLGLLGQTRLPGSRTSEPRLDRRTRLDGRSRLA
jgi:phage tail-like protein